MENPSRPAIHRNPYEVLGISRFCSSIKVAYRKLALGYHPAKNVDNPEASEHFSEVSYSYSILSDPERRRCYNNAGLEVAAILDFKDHIGGKQKSQRKLHKICLKTGSPVESHAAIILTPNALCKLQEELVLAPQFASFPVENGSFRVRHHTWMEGAK